jgi:hypothetical protein
MARITQLAAVYNVHRSRILFIDPLRDQHVSFLLPLITQTVHFLLVHFCIVVFFKNLYFFQMQTELMRYSESLKSKIQETAQESHFQNALQTNLMCARALKHPIAEFQNLNRNLSTVFTAEQVRLLHSAQKHASCFVHFDLDQHVNVTRYLQLLRSIDLFVTSPIPDALLSPFSIFDSKFEYHSVNSELNTLTDVLSVGVPIVIPVISIFSSTDFLSLLQNTGCFADDLVVRLYDSSNVLDFNDLLAEKLVYWLSHSQSRHVVAQCLHQHRVRETSAFFNASFQADRLLQSIKHAVFNNLTDLSSYRHQESTLQIPKFEADKISDSEKSKSNVELHQAQSNSLDLSKFDPQNRQFNHDDKFLFNAPPFGRYSNQRLQLIENIAISKFTNRTLVLCAHTAMLSPCGVFMPFVYDLPHLANYVSLHAPLVIFLNER